MALAGGAAMPKVAATRSKSKQQQQNHQAVASASSSRYLQQSSSKPSKHKQRDIIGYQPCCCCCSSLEAQQKQQDHIISCSNNTRLTALPSKPPIKMATNKHRQRQQQEEDQVTCSSKIISTKKIPRLPHVTSTSACSLADCPARKIAVGNPSGGGGWNSKLAPKRENPAVDCAKCQLIVRWTSAQAQLIARPLHQQHSTKAHGSKQGKCIQVSLHRDTRPACETQRLTGGGKTSEKSEPLKERKKNANQKIDLKTTTNDVAFGQQELADKAGNKFDESDEENWNDDISSLTDSSLNHDDDSRALSKQPDVGIDDQWSLSSASCYAPIAIRPPTKAVQSRRHSIQQLPSNHQRQQYQQVVAGSQHLSRPVSLAICDGQPLTRQPINQRKRRPAPLPPPVANSNHRYSNSTSNTNENGSLDSDNTSGIDTNASHSPTRLVDSDASQQNLVGKRRATATAAQQQQPDLLNESEVFSIEHFLRSHKSSVYVCGCMANLYLTSTRLVDNGRCSKPASESWQLSRTGVPVLTFDSGLAKNRSCRRLSISLAERGSGFILWSDIIDHLSNYRAYNAKLHGNLEANNTSEPSSAAAEDSNDDDVCDTFHVMYLSSNHRVMVGLSFDDAACARLFLKQVELITSDPTNIALTGPKLAHRLASVSRIGRLLSGSNKVVHSKGSSNVVSSSPVQEKKPWCSNGQQVGQLNKSDGKGVRSSKLTRIIGTTSGSRLRAEDCTWSTLKRAIRLGHQQYHNRHQSTRAKSKETTLVDETLGAFKPKPLALLAAAGKTYRPGKRMPRKCDISAPCLFQHVTRVDLSALNRLYSKSLVGGDGQLANEHNLISAAAAAVPSDSREETAQSPAITKTAQYNRLNGSSISASSCYSSASMSPASSECGRAASAAETAANQTTRPPIRHPSPPKVPERGTDDRASQQPVAAHNKIHAIIRELQAQTSSELVDAKRKLMADIADQVVARAAVSRL